MAVTGEFELIERYFKRATRDGAVKVGVGDDAAVLAVDPGCELVLAVDMMVESRHFDAGADPEALGHKILAVNLSDLAAMGARPRWALLAGALPDDDARWLAPFSRGLFALADLHEVALVGGDTTRGPRNLCLTIAGEVPAGEAIRRSGARPGDEVWVSGTLGDAMLGLAARQRRTKLSEVEFALTTSRLDRPTPRVLLGQRLRGVASAMIDVSDGLVGDLGHVLAASGVSATVELARIPCLPALAQRLHGAERALALACLLGGGDDYELCFTAPVAQRARVQAIAEDLAVSLACIGVAEPQGRGLVIVDERGAPLPALPPAFDHFRAAG